MDLLPDDERCRFTLMGSPLEGGAAEQQGDGVVADHDPRGKPQLGVHPKSAIGTAEFWCTLTRSVSQAWRIARPEAEGVRSGIWQVR